MADDPHETPHERLTLARLDARIALLERPRAKTWQERFVAQGAVVALLISLATGSYTLWDNFVVKPRASLEDDYGEVQKRIQQLAQINLATGQQVAAARDRGSASMIEAQGMAQKTPLLALILPEEPRVAARLSTPDYFVLSNEVMRTGDQALGLAFADKAVARARSPYETAEARRNRAALIFSTGRLADARAEFEAAMTTAAAPVLEYERANVLISWIGSELTNGDCARVPPLLARHADLIARPSVYENTRISQVTIVRGIVLGQRRCSVPPAAVPADPGAPLPPPPLSGAP